MRASGTVAALLALAVAAAGCDDLPRDSQGSLARAQSGTPLRVGWSPAPPWVVAGGGTADGPGGIEADLLRAWAAETGVRLAWVPAGDGQIVQSLQANTLDLAIAGFEMSQPWGARIGTTQPYLTAEIVVGAAPGAPVPGDWSGIEIRHDRRHPQIGAAIRRAGATPVAVEPGAPLAPLGAVYAPQLAARGLNPTGKRLASESHVIATAPAENALAFSLDRFLLARKDGTRARLAEAAR